MASEREAERGEPDVRNDVRAYARLSARLARHAGERAALLAAHGLDEEAWETLEDAWQARMSNEEDDAASDDGVPPTTRAFAEAFAESTRDDDVLPFERYVALTRELRSGVDLKDVLPRHGVDLPTYLASHRRYTVAMIDDPALAEALARALAGTPTETA